MSSLTMRSKEWLFLVGEGIPNETWGESFWILMSSLEGGV